MARATQPNWRSIVPGRNLAGTGIGPVTKRLNFTAAFVTRAVEGARRGGLIVSAVTVHPDGSVTVYGGAGAPTPTVPAQDDFDDMRAGGDEDDLRRSRRLLIERAMEFKRANPNAIHAEGKLWLPDEWTAHVCARPLNRRETAAVQILGAGQVGARVAWIKGAGVHMMERLAARGFVAPIERGAGRVPDYELTKAGKEAWTALQSK
jgi:hypothetical protein